MPPEKLRKKPANQRIDSFCGGENRLEREFWRLLDAAFRRLGVAAIKLKKILYFARLALFNAFRRFNVEDGNAKRTALASLCASIRLLI